MMPLQLAPALTRIRHAAGYNPPFAAARHRRTEHARPLRPHRDRLRPGRRGAGATAGADWQEDPDPRTRRLAEAFTGQLEREVGLHRQHVPGGRNLVRQDRQGVPSGPALFRGRQFQDVRRRAVPPARARLRGNPPRRWHLARVATEVRRVRALLRRSRKAFPRARRGRRRPDRTAPRRAVSVSAGRTRAADAATVGHVRAPRAASVPHAARHPA